MTEGDIDAVLGIERASFSRPWSRGMFIDELLQQGAGRYWVVADSPWGVVGFAGLMEAGDEVHLLDLAVRDDARERGLGSALLAALAGEARRRDAAVMTLEVRPSNASALALYGAAGFEKAGTRPGYYADTGEAAVIMTTPPLDRDDVAMRIESLARHGAEGLAAFALERPSAYGDRRHDDLILGIETSCDETAAAVVRGGREVVSSVVASQVDFHRRFGGVVPEIASRKHTEAIVGVVDEALEAAGVGFADLDAVAVTYGPGLVGALVVGLSYAKGLALSRGLPLVGVNHLEGHLFANVLADPEAAPPFVALIVSGGHTSLVHCPAWGKYHILGSTLDDAAGEAFDKVAKALALGYPGGPVLSKMAAQGRPDAIAFPRAMLHSGDYDFSLSGLKTAVVNHIAAERRRGAEIDVPDLAASFQAAVIDVQVAKAVRAAEECGVKDFLLGGGVAANTALREALHEALAGAGVRLFVPPLSLCGDNAAMIAAAGHFRLWGGETLGPTAEAVPDLSIG